MDYYLNVGEDNDGWYVAKGHEQIMFGLTEENATEVCSLFKTIEQLQARVAELEAELDKADCINGKVIAENGDLKDQLASSEQRVAEWQPIETAPKDELILVGPTKRMGICAAMNHSRDGWVTETCSEWVSIYTPTHWMPLPKAPANTASS